MKHYVWVLIFSAIILALCVSTCKAEEFVNVKVGVCDLTSKNVDMSSVADVSYEYKYKLKGLPLISLAGETGLSYFWAKLPCNGIDFFDIGTTRYPGIDTVFDMGVFHGINPYITGKVYVDRVYGGIGAGYVQSFFKEYYDGSASVDNELEFHIVAGLDLVKGLFIEGKYLVADLNIESGVYPTGIMENDSRLNNWQVMIGYKIKL